MFSGFLFKTRKYPVRLAGLVVAVALLNVATVYAQTVPDMRGSFTGTQNALLMNCTDPDDNGVFSGNLTIGGANPNRH